MPARRLAAALVLIAAVSAVAISRDRLDGTVRRADVPFVDTSVKWSPDGRQPLFADPIPAFVTQLPTSRTLSAFDGRPTGIILPRSAHGSFDRDGRRYIGRWWDGYSPPELRVFSCTPS